MKFINRLVEMLFLKTPPFHAGDKIVCINESSQVKATDKLVKGTTYTVKSVTNISNDLWSITLDGMVAGHNLDGKEIGYSHKRFSKVKNDN